MCSSKLKLFCSSTILLWSHGHLVIYAYTKCPTACLAYPDRVESGTGSCLMASFPRNGLHFEFRSFLGTKMFCKARLYFYLILSWIWRNNGDEWRRRERISQSRDRSSHLGHSSSITPRGRPCRCDRESCFSVLRRGLYDFCFWSSFMYVHSWPDWSGLKISRLNSSRIF